jgi:hypothetical protein
MPVPTGVGYVERNGSDFREMWLKVQMKMGAEYPAGRVLGLDCSGYSWFTVLWLLLWVQLVHSAVVTAVGRVG